MRIGVNGFFLPWPSTGSGQYSRHLLATLGRLDQDNEYDLFVLRRPEAWPQDATSGLWRSQPAPPNFVTWYVRTPFDRFSDNLAKLWFEQLSFPRLCRIGRHEVAHVPYFASPLRPTVPTVVTIHDLIPLILPAYRGSLLVRAYTRLVALAARQAQAVIADSEASRQDIVQRLGIPQERVHVIYLAVEERFRPLEEADQLDGIRHKYHLPKEFILYLGGFDQRKNLKTLVEAFAVLPATLDSYQLVIAGLTPAQDTPFFPDPRRLAREAMVDHKVLFIGWVPEEDKPALYNAATLFVFPSLYEGFGLPVLEALACGTPAITSLVSSLPEVLGEGGMLIDPTQPWALAEAMTALLSDEERRQRAREKALEQAARFSWEHTARQTLEVYHQCAS